jgi:DNA-binding CsgD family transcriptional regulator
VLPPDKDYARARRRIETALEQPHANAHAIVETFLAESADLLAIRSSCWHGTDPASGSMLDGATAGEAPGSFEESLVYEYRRPDVNRFADLSTGRDKAAAISTSTGNRLSASARFREMIEPTGVADELRVAFSDAYGMWMSLAVFTARRMIEEDLRFVADVVPGATSAMREATLSPDASAGPVDPADGAAPSVLLPGSGGDQAPGVMSFLAARARWDRGGGPATARMRALDGRWFNIDVSLLDDAASGNVAAVVQPAPGELVLDTVLRAMGLSAREREVALLLAQGRPTKSIAATLGLSPWTVQDHIKAVYAKTGVSRADLGSLGAQPAVTR